MPDVLTVAVHPGVRAILTAVFLAMGTGAAAAEGELFERDEPLWIRIEGPLTTLAVQPEDERDWLDGKLTVREEDGTESVFDIRLKGRSMTRRRPGVCDFPPFWIDFRKGQIEGTRFAGSERLKVVSHCRESPLSFDHYILLEYLAYRSHGLLTEEGFRVRLLNVQYMDTEDPRESAPRAAFFIENLDSVARRLGGEAFEASMVYPDQFDPFALKRAELFQFMIGNTDFSFEAGVDECCHNSKVLTFDPPAAGYLPLPYDFDMSGVVNPPYAVPHPEFGISRVTQRVFRGTMAPEEVWERTFALFRERKDAILALWSGFDPLDKSSRKRAVKYLDGFYSILENEKKARAQIVDKARDPERITAILDRKKASISREEAGDLLTASPQ